MTHGSLFSGIGGFDLAAEWMGWENLFHCEWNEFGQKVLHHYWPDAEQFTDITKTDFRKYANRIDILTGGFPCQPYSLAGKRKGKEDERHLWPEMLRAIREIQPRWVVGENVHGLVNWDGGLVFHEVQTDLEAAGYEVFPYVLPACAINAPHRRDRVWFVAYHNRNGQHGSDSEHEKHTDKGREYAQRNIKQSVANGSTSNTAGDGHTTRCKETNGENRSSEQVGMQQSSGMGSEWDATDTAIERLEGREWGGAKGERFTGSRKNGSERDAADTDSKLHKGRGNENRPEKAKRYISAPFQYNAWENFPTESPICSGNDEFSNRLDGITFSKWRNESIKAYGNAVVPALVLQIFKTIEAYEKL
jgi:DNA (cytosine-5)-methyltransferase 1